MGNPSDNDKAKKLLQKYLTGDCTSEEEEQVLRWYYSFRQEDDPPDNKKAELTILRSVKENVLKSTIVKRNTPFKVFNLTLLRVAALLVIALTITFIGVRHNSKPQIPAITYNEISTAKGERKEISLPDGSMVTLNAVSSIRIPSDFGTENRAIELKGEGFFEVVHNAQKPFLVKTGKLITKDIGTSFDIQAYPDENKIQVAVITGKVSINQKSATGTKQLAEEIHHNQMLEYYRDNSRHLLKTVNAGHIAAWKNNDLYFDAVSIPEIARILERKYNVNIKVIGANTNACLYTVKFRDETVNRALDILTNLSGTTWQAYQNQIIINVKNCR